MLTVCYSPKGGQGCTTVTAALALAQRGSRLIDTTGDLPAVLGLPETSGPGICDLLADDQALEVAAIERLAVNAGLISLVIAGSTPAAAVPEHRWAELAATLTADRGAWFLDAGTNPAAASVAADRKLLVVRNCYLALRRAVAHPVRPDGVVLVTEPGRALAAADVEAVLTAPVVAEIAIDPAVARTIDAGLLAARLPRTLARSLGALTLGDEVASRV
jgi:MinD-like ATPase involved in chromosome partitioning or flagellar assembly